MFWRKSKNKTNEYYDIIGLSNTEELKFSSYNDFLLIIGRALLCFLLTVGSICGYTSCFGAKFNLYLVMIILAFCSLVIAYVKNLKSNAIKNLSYIAFFFIFTFTILRMYRYVNSGYHALVNLTYASLENYLDIPALVYYEEIIESSYHTITYFMIFLGIFELFIFHMWISDRFSLLSIFLISFGPYIVPLFINLIPDDFYIICLLTAYISSIILCCCFHGHTPKKHDKYIVFRKINPWSPKIKGFSYGTNGLTYLLSICFSFLAAVAIFVTVSTTVPYSVYQRTEKISSLKASVMDEVKYFVTFGLSGYFNRYSSTGGLSDGSLGGIYSVRPDYETDLTITYVPLSSEPVYLRGYTGYAYTDRKWLSANEILADNLISDETYRIFTRDAALSDEFSYLKSYDFANSPLRMDVKNIDANVSYSYSPYYTDPALFDSLYAYTNQNDYFYINRTRTYGYYPASYFGNNTNNQKKDSSIINASLQIPSDTRKEVIEFLEDNNLLTKYITKKSEFANLSGSELQSIINSLSDQLTNNFTYSLNPGVTPKNEDFVGYFLNENQKGFCAHFATSATLILRTLGIPARYVEGYVLTSEDLVDARLVTDAAVSDYVTLQMVNNNAVVVEVDIADDKAHAWVEYYDSEFGWRVFEATTASMEGSSNFDFWASLYGFLNDEGEPVEVGEVSDIDSSTVAKILYRLLFVMVIIVVVFVFSFYLYRGIKRYRSYHRSNYNINVRNYYKIICKKICTRYPEFDYIISNSAQLEFIFTHYKISKKFMKNDISKLSLILERAAFSNVRLTFFEYQYSMKMLKLLRRNITFKI